MCEIETVSKGYFQKIGEFRFVKKIGVGSFGQVNLAVHKPTKKKYAIKVIDLNEDFSQVQIKLIERQIKMHISLDHPHIIKLWDTLVQNNKVYMIMEYASNGSLFHYHSNLLSRRIMPSNQQVYKFISQTVSAIKYMHLNDCMHRDIKPENILLDENFNIKICDFGWVTNQIHSPRNTFCGTYEYMAPQMIFQQSYDYKIDIWAIGVLLYQLLHGSAPFSGETLEEVRERIQSGSYQIKRNISPSLRNLIIQILQLKPSQRLSIQQIVNHPWIKANQNRQQNSFDSHKTINFRNSEYQPTDDVPLSIICNDSNLQNNKELKSLFRDHSSKENLTISKSKTNKKSPYLKSFLNQNKETVKKNLSQKRIKKKCKTQGEEEINSYEDYLFLKNLGLYRNKGELFGDQLIRPNKKNEYHNHKDIERKKRTFCLEETKKMKKQCMKHYEKNFDKMDKMGRIQKKLHDLSNKFFEEKAKQESFGSRQLCRKS